MDEREVDEEFAALVDQLRTMPDTPQPPPADAPRAGSDGSTPGLEEPADEIGEAADQDAVIPGVNPPLTSIVITGERWRAASEPNPETAASRDEDHFEPPPVELPPQEDLHFWGAVAGLVAGPVLLLYVVIARPFHGGWWLTAALVLTLAGFGLLILRSPTHRDPFDPDDGARV